MTDAPQTPAEVSNWYPVSFFLFTYVIFSIATQCVFWPIDMVKEELMFAGYIDSYSPLCK